MTAIVEQIKKKNELEMKIKTMAKNKIRKYHEMRSVCVCECVCLYLLYFYSHL